MKFLRTVRLDQSDDTVFPRAAEPDEWAVPGTFAFSNADSDSLKRKDRIAFRNGWLGIDSFGWSTLVRIADIEDADLDGVVHRLANHFVADYGAPDFMAAVPAAREEAAYANDLADHPVGTLLAIVREFTDQGVSEQVHVIDTHQRGARPRVWDLIPAEDQGGNKQ